MTDIENTKYITVKRDTNGEIEIFVGDKPATHYYEERIFLPEKVMEDFAWIQKQNPDIEEFHIISSKTPGKYFNSGNPSEERGPYAWCRIKLKNGFVGNWVFYFDAGSSAFCASFCADYCGSYVRGNATLRSTMFGSVAPQTETGAPDLIKKEPDVQLVTSVSKPETILKQKFQGIDLSELAGKSVELNGYEIIVRKIKQDIKQK